MTPENASANSIEFGLNHTNELIVDMLTKWNNSLNVKETLQFKRIYKSFQDAGVDIMEAAFQECKKDAEFCNYITENNTYPLPVTLHDVRHHLIYVMDSVLREQIKITKSPEKLRSLLGVKCYNELQKIENCLFKDTKPCGRICHSTHQSCWEM